jgi:hypothetical protein
MSTNCISAVAMLISRSDNSVVALISISLPLFLYSTISLSNIGEDISQNSIYSSKRPSQGLRWAIDIAGQKIVKALKR